MFSRLKPYLFTRSELSHFLAIAVPMVISNATDALMMFVDRLFLAHYGTGSGEAYINAALIGAITSFVSISFFAVIAGYSNALVAQYYGAQKKHMCSKVVSQSVLFAFVVYPLMIAASFLMPWFFNLFGHSPLQTQLESTYTRVLLLGSVFSVLRAGIGGFFIGIHKTKIVMIANLAGLVINVPLNYVFIFGTGVTPSLGIAGAAIATIISSAVACAILIAYYVAHKTHREFVTRIFPKIDWSIMRRLIRFGLPTGVELVFGLLVFDFFIMAMSSYGESVGAAVTIAINWDSMFFIPMIGAGFATTAVVGQHMGARNIFQARRAVFLSCTVMFVYAVIVGALMIIFSYPLVNMFLENMASKNEVRPLAVIMMRLASLYLLADSLNISIAGALRGAGDTRAVMTIFLIINAIFGAAIFTFAMNRLVSPLGAWLIFVCFAIALGFGMLARFLGGKWQHIVMVDDHHADDAVRTK